MRRVTYKSVLDRIAGYFGEARGLSTEEATLANVKVNFFARLGWRAFWFPELLSVERRVLRAAWDSTKTYGARDQVWDANSGGYFQSLQAGNFDEPPTTDAQFTVNGVWWAALAPSYSGDDYVSGTTYAVGNIVRNPADGQFYQCIQPGTPTMTTTNFGLLTPFVRSLDYEDVTTALDGNGNPIGEVKALYRNDPNVYPQWRHLRIAFELGTSYVLVGGAPWMCPSQTFAGPTGGVFWLEHRKRVPSWSGATRSDGVTYVSGTTVYDTQTGDYWTSVATVNPGESPTSTPAKWSRVEFPYVLGEFVSQSAYASLVNREQEEPENYTVEQAAGYPLLVQEMDIVERQQGQTRQLRVVGRRGY